MTRLLTLLFLLLAALPAGAERRVALLIGNSNYEAAGVLPNPASDVELLRAALEAPPLAFEVTTLADATRAQMAQGVASFLAATRDADITLVFYAGHGLQYDGENYLVGVDARLATPFDLQSEALALNDLVSLLQRENRTALVFVDACRNNPLARSFYAAAGATRDMTPGLAPVELAPATSREAGTMLAFSASPGQVALDGPAGGNSPFAVSLATHIREPGIELLSVMKRVIGDVRATTEDRQVPIVTNDLAREIYLVASPGEATGDAETMAFTAAVEAGTEAAFAAYLRAYPRGRFATLAALELERLREEAQTAALDPIAPAEAPAALPAAAGAKPAPAVPLAQPDAAPASAPGLPDFGDDSSFWANDGECDDTRFEGEGMTDALTDLDQLKDATDCRAAWDAGTIRLRDAPAAPSALAAPADATTDAPAAPAPVQSPGPTAVLYGDNTGQWAKDGECDDRRFAGPGVGDWLGFSEVGRDSTDCRDLAEAGEVALWDLAASQAATQCDAIDWGDDSGEAAKDDECGDPRFEGLAMSAFVGPESAGRDATDCRRLCGFGVVSLRDY